MYEVKIMEKDSTGAAIVCSTDYFRTLLFALRHIKDAVSGLDYDFAGAEIVNHYQNEATSRLDSAGIDEVVRRNTAFESMADLCEHSIGDYTPTLRADLDPDLVEVADIFNYRMAKAYGMPHKRAFLVR